VFNETFGDWFSANWAINILLIFSVKVNPLLNTFSMEQVHVIASKNRKFLARLELHNANGALLLFVKFERFDQRFSKFLRSLISKSSDRLHSVSDACVQAADLTWSGGLRSGQEICITSELVQSVFCIPLIA
jgi:hypothetical protein